VVTGIVLDPRLVVSVCGNKIAMTAVRFADPGAARIVAVNGVIAGADDVSDEFVVVEPIPVPVVGVEVPEAVGVVVPTPIDDGSSKTKIVSVKLWNDDCPVTTGLNSRMTWIPVFDPVADAAVPRLPVDDGTREPTAAGTFPTGATAGWKAATDRSCRDSSDSAQKNTRRRALSDRGRVDIVEDKRAMRHLTTWYGRGHRFKPGEAILLPL
jgi:hypothetical protein